MLFPEKIIKKFYKIEEGNSFRRVFFTMLIGSGFAIITSLTIIIPVFIQNLFKIPKIPSYPMNYILSIPLTAAGLFFMLWSNISFIKAKGTPVPVNPPPVLITSGPFAFSRNPMHGGMFLLLFGLGIYYGSLLSVFLFIPLYIFLDIQILKKIEEPELEKRLGEEYIVYKKRTPMFLGWRMRVK